MSGECRREARHDEERETHENRDQRETVRSEVVDDRMRSFFDLLTKPTGQMPELTEKSAIRKTNVNTVSLSDP